MKIALTFWENRISPVFDSAKLLLIAEVEKEKEVNSQYVQFNPESPLLFVEMLNRMDVEVLICGAISEVPAAMLEASGIKLIPFISGNAEEILKLFAKKHPLIPKYLMPGCGRKRRGKGNKKNVFFSQQKEVSSMAKKDGTGPQGQGRGTGKGRGGCGAGKGGKGTGQGKGGGQCTGPGRGRGQGQGNS